MLYHLHTIVSALCFSTTVFAHVPPEYTPPHGLETRAKNTGCNQLKDKYPNLVSFPNTPTYTLENTSKQDSLPTRTAVDRTTDQVLSPYRLLFRISNPLARMCLQAKARRGHRRCSAHHPRDQDKFRRPGWRTYAYSRSRFDEPRSSDSHDQLQQERTRYIRQSASG